MSTTTREIDDYVAAVHAALADLPDSEREDLLDDLPQHLADVQADASSRRGGTLVELIGSPEAYAAELRSTAGLDAPRQKRDWWQSARTRLVSADARAGALLGYDRIVDLVRALFPAWWLVRAWLVVEFCTGATHRSGAKALVPEIGGNRVAGVVLLVLAMAASVWLGRRGLARRWQRSTLVVIGLLLAVYGIALAHHASAASVRYVDYGSDDGTSGLSNIYPVGPDGTVLKNVRLYDQDGNPVQLGDAVCPADDGTEYFHVDGDENDQNGTSQAATSAAPSAATTDGSQLYPLTCAANQGPFPSGQASALPGTSAPAASSTPSASPSPSTSTASGPSAPVATTSPTASSTPRTARVVPTAAPTG